MKNLKKATDEVANSQTQKEKLESLSKAFEIFSQETSRLENAYLELNQQFQALNLELEDRNNQLKAKVNELDLITYYLNSILTNISQGILFIDIEGTITTYNRAAEKILGIKGTKVLFSSYWQNFKDDLFGFSIKGVLETLESPQTSYCTYHNQAGEAAELEIDVTFVLKDEDDNSPISTQGLIILIRDITEIRRLQMLALRNDRMKELGEMAAQVAHEIRNPLGGIKGFASLLHRDLKDNPSLQQMARYIVEGTDNLNRLVTQVLNYSRPIQPHFEHVDLLRILEEMKLHVLADQRIKTDDFKIIVESHKKSVMCMVDPQLLKGALLNLIVNSIQAMPNGGQITLSAEQEGSNIIIGVADTGQGIPAENLEKIFSPFFTTKSEGNGFGLPEVHKIIQAHAGSIEVKSKIGVGTVFIIKLPLSAKTSPCKLKKEQHGNR